MKKENIVKCKCIKNQSLVLSPDARFINKTIKYMYQANMQNLGQIYDAINDSKSKFQF